MVDCLVIEDDERTRRRLVNRIRTDFQELNCIGEAHTLERAKILIQELRPKLLFMDINLPDGTAFDLLKALPSLKSKIIFITAHSDYALEAIRFSALDFLLKPYTRLDLNNAIRRALEAIDEQEYHLKLESFYHNHLQEDHRKKKIVLKSAENIYLIEIQDIIQVKADNNYTVFYLQEDKKVVISKSLKEFDNKLAPYGFFRAHQSHLINWQHAITFKKKEDRLLMTGGIHIPIAQSKKQDFIRYFEALED